MTEVHRAGCQCRSCVDYTKVEDKPGKPHRRHRRCQPGCNCRRHDRHNGYKPRHDAEPNGRAGRNRCVCGHLDVRHDSFGCKTCDGQDRDCPEFRSRADYFDKCARCRHLPSRHNTQCESCKLYGKSCPEYVPPTKYHTKDKTFINEVKRNGFIHHVGELATCSNCWQVIKIGLAHSVSSVINARAHSQLCRSRVRHVG